MNIRPTLLLLVYFCLLLGQFANAKPQVPLVIAVVDDAFRVSHEMFAGMRWQNPNEVPNNGIDDDGNGYIDDIYGWDVSDQDNELLPPASRAKEFAHGTNMAGIIASHIKDHFGEQKNYPIKLMFVKAVSDTAQQVNLKDGYKGIDYALKNGADIISLSWGGGKYTDEAKQVLQRARQQGVTIIASLGTYPQADPSYPSAHPATIGVAGVDDEGKLLSSNFGAEADVLGRSSSVKTADVLADSAYGSTLGVSNSVAIVAAQAAIAKFENPSLSDSSLRHCLQGSALPQDIVNSDIAGKLGAGLVDLKGLLNCASNLGRAIDGERAQAKGSLYYTRHANKGSKTTSWQLRPEGKFGGLTLKPYVQGKVRKTQVRITSQPDNNLVWEGLATQLPASIDTTSTHLDIELIAKTKSDFTFGLQYATKNIEFAEVYCKGLIVIEEPILIEDGSGDKSYAANSSCKWLIKPKEGFDIGLTFTDLDTEINTDGVYLFRGNGTQKSNMLMRITGKELPHKIIVQQSEVLLWFVSNDSVEGQGFKVQVSQEPRPASQ